MKRDITKTLATRDPAEARRRLPDALAAIRAEADDKLRAAGFNPLSSGWVAPWSHRAVAMRAEMRKASSVPYATAEDERGAEQWTTRDDVHDEIVEEAREIEQREGRDAARCFYQIATAEVPTLAEALAQWIAQEERAGRVRAATIAGHRAALALLGDFLKEKRDVPSLETATLEPFDRRTASAFVDWRLNTISPKTGRSVAPATVQRELSSVSGLWRWAVRNDHAETNPVARPHCDLAARSHPNRADGR